MTEIIGVKFNSGGKQYFFDPKGLTVKTGQGVIVETGKGLEYGVCTRPNGWVEDTTVVQPLRQVVRIATSHDEQTVADNVIRERRAMELCQEKILKHKLDMKLIRVEYAFDGSKVLFFFTSEGRVDFRALVKDLAASLRTRIELRQIGVRDEARMLGGLGICGKPFCCNQFLNEFQPVSIKMAKTQNLSLNPTKISGTCGRLMCCLKYEQDAYEDAVRRCPRNESFVECPDGVGHITAVNLLRERVKVKLEDSNEFPKDYRVDEIRVVQSGKGKRPDHYVAPSKAELEKLRFIPSEKDMPTEKYGNDRLAAALESILSRKYDPDSEQSAPSAPTAEKSQSVHRKSKSTVKKLVKTSSGVDLTQIQELPKSASSRAERKLSQSKSHHKRLPQPKPKNPDPDQFTELTAQEFNASASRPYSGKKFKSNRRHPVKGKNKNKNNGSSAQ